MAGLFDNLFGSAGGMYADMLSPEQQAAIRRQSMMQVAAKLLQSSGPSPVRQSFGQIAGGALAAGADAVQSGQTNAVQQMLLKQKLDEAKRDVELQKQWQSAFSRIAPTTTIAPLTPEQAIVSQGAGRVGPTPQRAGLINTAPTAQAQNQSPLSSAIGNLNPLQQLLLSSTSYKSGPEMLNSMINQSARRMTADEVAQYGLPAGTSATIEGTGKVNVLAQPRLQIATSPSGAVNVVNLDAMYSPSPAVAATAPAPAAAAPAPAPAPAATTPTRTSPAPARPRAQGGRPGITPLFEASLNPEQVLSESRNWTTSVYSPVSEVVQNFETVKELLKSGQGGISDYGVLIKSIKALEPNSAVMQGEADSARNMMSLANRMESIMGQVERGGMGSDAARLQLAELARSATNVAVNAYNKKLERQRKIYGNNIPQAQVDAILAEIPMPAGAESSEALRALIMPQQQSGAQGGQPQMVFNPSTNRWERR
jgi:hypothetical protein